MKNGLPLFILSLLLALFPDSIRGQLIITAQPDAQALAQRLVGEGVSISNVSFTGNPLMASFFHNRANRTQIGIDSGIVLTTGRAKTLDGNWGVDGNGTLMASSVEASTGWALPGDPDLAIAIGNSNLRDACVLEFDFVPLGDSIKFNYVFSSEEYVADYVCSFNDAFAFFISGPGITGLKNIALIPGTNIPVSIFNVNNVPGGNCPNNDQYYVDNSSNTFFTHDGHTTVFTATEKVQPCLVYHLKMVLADASDAVVDSGVFLQARSLSSNAFGISNLTQTDPGGNSYLAEGCVTGTFSITRPRKDPFPLNIQLTYGGTASNGTDVALLPLNVLIPANDSFVTVNVVPLVDGLPEGIEVIKVFALAGCASGTPTDSTLIQIRDYDILPLAPDTSAVCRGGSVQLNASPGYSIYQWLPDPSLSNTGIPNPVATPVNNTTTYTCTATEGTCHARDSVFIQMKTVELQSKTDVNCRGGVTGTIQVKTGAGWVPPLSYSLDGVNWQTADSFSNLPIGDYRVKVKDASCTDSVLVTLIQAFPDLLVDNTSISPAGCSGNPDGQAGLTVSGGKAPYLFSVDGINFQSTGLFNLGNGNYSITIKDENGCLLSQPVSIPLNNTVTIDAGIDTAICEGTSYRMNAGSNGSSFLWTPATGTQNATSLNPTVSPADTTLYYVTASTGICSRTDSVTINVWPAPVANAGPDISDCFGKIIQLNGSGGTHFNWTPATYFTTASDIAAPSLKATAGITYFLSVKDDRGCQSVTTDDIKVNVTPAVRLFAGRDTVAAMNQPVQLKVIELSNAGVIRYSWSPSFFLDKADIAGPVAILPHNITYTVTGTTADGCEGIDDVFVKVYKGPEIYVPSGFTPDGNGLNDELKAFPVGIREFHFFRVFNRWGQLVFQAKDPGKGWDGTINGIRQPTGTFIWMAEAVDYKGGLMSRKGLVTLIR
ncbi:MAG: choice-of-anchor L domain-containing protein [Sphingobacteriales bacterium]|nr:choice-of-anchor L domain-containing protein [Sphingobacteriales bacterium]